MSEPDPSSYLTSLQKSDSNNLVLEQPSQETIQGTVSLIPHTIEGTVSVINQDNLVSDASESRIDQQTYEGDTNAEQPAEQENTPETEGESVQVSEEKQENKSRIMGAISGLIGKLNLSDSFGSILNDGVNSKLMVDLMENMANASTNKPSNKSNNNTKTLTFLILYNGGKNDIKNQDINVLPTPPFNITIKQTKFTLSNAESVQNTVNESGIELNDVSIDPIKIKIIICIHENGIYAQYINLTSGGRKTRNRHKKHNKNKSGVHKPQRERKRRTIKKHIKYRCNKKTYKIDIIIQLPE
jgi:hypothetical protein